MMNTPVLPPVNFDRSTGLADSMMKKLSLTRVSSGSGAGAGCCAAIVMDHAPAPSNRPSTIDRLIRPPDGSLHHSARSDISFALSLYATLSIYPDAVRPGGGSASIGITQVKEKSQ